jgi:hypothetical protein
LVIGKAYPSNSEPYGLLAVNSLCKALEGNKSEQAKGFEH